MSFVPRPALIVVADLGVGTVGPVGVIHDEIVVREVEFGGGAGDAQGLRDQGLRPAAGKRGEGRTGEVEGSHVLGRGHIECGRTGHADRQPGRGHSAHVGIQIDRAARHVERGATAVGLRAGNGHGSASRLRERSREIREAGVERNVRARRGDRGVAGGVRQRRLAVEFQRVAADAGDGQRPAARDGQAIERELVSESAAAVRHADGRVA